VLAATIMCSQDEARAHDNTAWSCDQHPVFSWSIGAKIHVESVARLSWSARASATACFYHPDGVHTLLWRVLVMDNQEMPRATYVASGREPGQPNDALPLTARLLEGIRWNIGRFNVAMVHARILQGAADRGLASVIDRSSDWQELGITFRFPGWPKWETRLSASGWPPVKEPRSTEALAWDFWQRMGTELRRDFP